MFKSVFIDNFRSFRDFSVDLSNVSVIVGNNAVGKSSFLLAMDFLCSFAKEEFSVFMDRNNICVENIKNKFEKASKMRFESIIRLEIDGKEIELLWKVVLKVFLGNNEIFLSEEEISVGNELLMYYREGEGFRYKTIKEDVVVATMDFRMYSSCLKNIRKERADERIVALIDFLKKSESFAMLSPGEMRQSSRSKDFSIGVSGRNLSSFIKRMPEDVKRDYLHRIRNLRDIQIGEVTTKAKGKPGWVELEVLEAYGNRLYSFNAKEVSDGMLRLLAFLAIMEMGRNNSMFLLDEIENGINSSYAEQLIKMFSDLSEKNRIQMLLTTHSTVFLDYVEKESIIILYRDKESGDTRAIPFMSIPGIEEKIEYMYPGEIVLNQGISDLVESVLKEEKYD